jgi:AraC family transcriptional regulator
MAVDSERAPLAAAAIAPETIDKRATLAEDAKLLLRRRPPGSVKLSGGHQEHLLMCNLGTPAGPGPIRSTLSSALGERTWQHCPTEEVTFIPAGFPMEWEWSYESRSVHILLEPSFLSGECEGLPAAELEPYFRVRDPVVSGLLWELGKEIRSPGFAADLATSSLLNLLKVHLRRPRQVDYRKHERETAEPRQGLSTAQEDCVVQLINDRLSENISLDELSKTCDLSPHHFARMFKRRTGYAPHQYQLYLRIARAQRLLSLSPRRSVVDIACELGFADESHFRRHFKRIVGVTPSEYRKQQ